MFTDDPVVVYARDIRTAAGIVQLKVVHRSYNNSYSYEYSWESPKGEILHREYRLTDAEVFYAANGDTHILARLEVDCLRSLGIMAFQER